MLGLQPHHEQHEKPTLRPKPEPAKRHGPSSHRPSKPGSPSHPKGASKPKDGTPHAKRHHRKSAPRVEAPAGQAPDRDTMRLVLDAPMGVLS